MKQTKHFKRTALSKSAKSMVSLMLLLIAMLMPQGAWAGACAYTPGCASLEDMQVHLNGTNGNYNGSANNEVVASLKFNYWLDIFNYDGDNGYWDRDLTMKIDDQTLTFYSDYACTTKVSTDYSTVLQGVWGVFGDSNEDHTIGKNKSGSGNKAYFKTSSGLKGYINIYNYYAASNKWTTMKVEVFIYDLYGHKVSVCGTYKRSGKSDIAYDYVFYLGGCPRPKNVTTSQSTTKKEVTVSWQKETYSIPASDATGETRVKAYNVIDNGSWGVYRNDNYNTSIQTVGNTVTSAADNSASCSSSPYTYNVCYEPKATYGSNGTSLKGDVTSQRGISGSSSITLTHVWSNSGSEKDPATCTTAAVHYQTCIYCSSTSDANHTYTSGSALGHGTTGYTESYSWTGNAYNDASQDTKACTFTLTCKKCSTKVVNGESLTCIKTAHVDALCTATGSTTYQATGSYTAANSAYNYSKTVTNVYTVAVLRHIYSPGSWSWAPDGHSATCTRTCIRTGCTTNTPGHTFSKSVTLGNGIASFQGVAPTCNAMGMTRYIATATVEGTLYSATKDVLDIAALGHSYGAGAWSWADDGHTATCTRTCDRTGCYTNTPGHTSSKSVTLGNGITSEQQVAPNCTTKGTTRYTATATVEGTQYSDTKDVVDIAALDHDYSQVEDANYLVSPATCTNDAVYHEKCSRCDTKEGPLWRVKGTATGNHDFTSHTLTDGPVTSGLYAYTCDYGCWHYDEHRFIKDFYGEGNHLELTEDGAGNYSTSEDIILADANGFASPIDFTANSVTYTRTGIKNQWGTIVVPFDVNGSGDDYDLYTLSGGSEDELTLTKVNGTLAAGTPVLIRLHDDLDGDYDLTLTAANTAVSCQLAEGSKADGYQLVGTYETTELSADDYFLSNNKFWNVGDMYPRAYGVKTAPFRAYLRSSNPYFAKALSINIADEDVTAVETLNAITEGDAEYYDMNGRRINSLQKGVNIVKYGNGKTVKVTIK